MFPVSTQRQTPHYPLKKAMCLIRYDCSLWKQNRNHGVVCKGMTHAAKYISDQDPRV